MAAKYQTDEQTDLDSTGLVDFFAEPDPIDDLPVIDHDCVTHAQYDQYGLGGAFVCQLCGRDLLPAD